MKNMIELRLISKLYGTESVFQDLDLKFQNGKTYTIIGQSGCGNHVMNDLIIELDYILQKSRKDDNSEFESVNHIFRLREKYNIAKGLIFN